MWELLLEFLGPLLLDTVASARKPKGDVPKMNAEAKEHLRAGRYAEAEALYRRALAIRQAHVGEKHRSSAYYLSYLGETVQAQERYEEANGYYQSSLQTYKEVEGPVSLNVAHQLGNLGNLRLAQKSYLEAESYLTRALAVYEQLIEPQPLSILRRQKSLAWVYYHLKRNDQARGLADRVRAGYEQLQETDSSEYIDCLDLLCCLDTRQKRIADRIPMLRLVKEKRETLGSTEDLLYAAWLGILGRILLKQKQWTEAEPILIQAIGLQRKMGAIEGLILNLIQLADSYTSQERFEEAEPFLAEGLRLSRAHLSAESMFYHVMLMAAARGYYCQERAEDAIALCEEYLELYKKVQHDEVKLLFSSRIILGRMYGRMRKYWQAEAQLAEAQTLSRAKWGENSRQYALVIASLGESRHFQSRDAEALPLAMQAIELLRQIPDLNQQTWKAAHRIAAEILDSQGQWREAEAIRAAIPTA